MSVGNSLQDSQKREKMHLKPHTRRCENIKGKVQSGSDIQGHHVHYNLSCQPMFFSSFLFIQISDDGKIKGQEISFHPKIILDLPPGGLWTFTEVFPAAWLLSLRGWLTIGLVATVLVGLVASGTCQPIEKLLLPPGA